MEILFEVLGELLEFLLELAGDIIFGHPNGRFSSKIPKGVIVFLRCIVSVLFLALIGVFIAVSVSSDIPPVARGLCAACAAMLATLLLKLYWNLRKSKG